MSRSAGAESSTNTLVALSASQNSQLAAPAEAKETPVALHGRELLRQCLAEDQQLLQVGLGVASRAEEGLHLLLLLLGVHGNGVDVQTWAIEEVGDQDDESSVSGETVSALDGLMPDAEDVVDVDNSLGGILRSHDV